MRDKKTFNSLYWGSVLIATGIVIALNYLNILPDGIYKFLISWPMLMIVVGFYFVASSGSVLGFVILVIGVILAAMKLFKALLYLNKYILPILLITVGMYLVGKVLSSKN